MPIYTQAVAVPAPAVPPTPTIALASFAQTSTPYGGSVAVTVAITAAPVGSIMVAAISIDGVTNATGVTLTSLHATWHSLGGGAQSLWWAQVTTAGADTLTINPIGATGNTGPVILGLGQYTSSLGAVAVWSASALGTASGTAVKALPWGVPVALPTGGSVPYLYYGLLHIASNAVATSGGGVGYVYHSIAYTGIIAVQQWVAYNLALAALPVVPALTTTVNATSVSNGVVFSAAQGVVPPSTGDAQLYITPVPQGKAWEVSQIGFEIIPLPATDPGALVATDLNGRLLYGNISAFGGFTQGPPYVTLQAGDAISFDCPTIPAGSSLVINLYYNEYVSGDVPEAADTI